RVDARGEHTQGATWFAAVYGSAGMKEVSRLFRERAWQSGATADRSDLLTWGYLNAMEAFDHFFVEELPWSFITRFMEALEAFRVVGEQSYRLTLCAFHGKVLHELGDVTSAETDLRKNLTHAERFNEAIPLTYVRAYLARLLAQTAPIDHLDEPEQLARSVTILNLLGEAHAALAEIRRRQGQLIEAEREVGAACEAVRPFPGYTWGIIALRGRILLEEGRAVESLTVAEAGVVELERLGIEGSGEIDLRLSWAEALHAVGRAEAAHAALADTLPRLKKRLDDIPEPAARERYLTNVPANARVVALARAWLGVRESWLR